MLQDTLQEGCCISLLQFSFIHMDYMLKLQYLIWEDNAYTADCI